MPIGFCPPIICKEPGFISSTDALQVTGGSPNTPRLNKPRSLCLSPQGKHSSPLTSLGASTELQFVNVPFLLIHTSEAISTAETSTDWQATLGKPNLLSTGFPRDARDRTCICGKVQQNSKKAKLRHSQRRLYKLIAPAFPRNSF